MKRFHMAALALSASLLTVSAAEANERYWTVAAVTGDVQVGTEFETRTPVAGMRIRPSETIQTGADGRVTLVRDANSIAAYENSRFQVRAPRNGSILTRVLQDAGQLLFQVEKRAGRHFEVETPYLVAGVKGTTFGVEVTGDGAEVNVVEGLVGVSDPETGEEVDVAAGQTATGDETTGVELVGETDTSTSQKWNERALQVSEAVDTAGPEAWGASATGIERSQLGASVSVGNGPGSGSDNAGSGSGNAGGSGSAPGNN